MSRVWLALLALAIIFGWVVCAVLTVSAASAGDYLGAGFNLALVAVNTVTLGVVVRAWRES